MRDPRRTLWVWKLLFWLYAVFLFVFVAVKFDGHWSSLLARIQTYETIREHEGEWNLNLIPFDSIRLQLRYIRQDWARRNLLANVLVFVPFGYLLPMAHRHLRRLLPVLATGLAASCVIEGFQYVTLLGSCDIDDVILNLLGSFLGALAFFLPRRADCSPA